MLIFEFLRVGWTVIRMHKFRAALTVMSIAIGTFSIVLMSSLATSATTTLARGLEDIGGARMVVVFPKEPDKAQKKRSSYQRGISYDDAVALRGRLPHVVSVGIANGNGDREVQYAGKTPPSADVVGSDDSFLSSFGIGLAAGRNLDLDDMNGRRRVVLLGHAIAKKLFATPAEGIGQVVRLGNDSFRVIGVAAEVKRFGVRLFFDWNEFAAVPLTALGPHATGAIVIMTDGAEHNDLAKRIAAAILRARHNGVDDFEAFDFAVMMEKLAAVFSVMHLIAGLVASVALLAGGIGVMNILLVSVSERVREIGVRKAIGAPDRAIGLQFLFESSLLSSLGGLFGVLLGCGAALVSGPIIRRSAEAWVAVISVGAVGAALVASLLIGIFFGLVPARKASRLMVVDCLRAAG